MDGAASRTFFAEAAVGFMKLAAVLLLFVGRRVRGRVVETPALELEDPMVRRLLGALQKNHVKMKIATTKKYVLEVLIYAYYIIYGLDQC